MKQRILSVLLILAMVLMMLPTALAAGSTDTTTVFSQNFDTYSDLSAWTKDGYNKNWFFGPYLSRNCLYMPTAQAGGRAMLTTGKTDWVNAAYSVKLAVTAENSGTLSPALIFGAQDASNCYLFMYANDVDSWRLYKRENGSFTKLGSDVAASLEARKFYTLTATISDGTVTCAVDGETKITVSDSTFSGGKLGVHTYYQTASEDRAYFADPQVTVASQPSVTPSTPSGSTLPYTENLTTSDAADWTHEEGNQTAGSTGLNGNGISSVGNTDWVNYTASATVSLSGSVAPGLLVRYQDAKNFYMLCYSATDHLIQLYKRENGTFTKLNEAALTLEENTAHTLTATVIGSSITGAVNGTTLLSCTDSTFTHGKLGIRITGTGSAQVTAISATAAPANSLFFDDFADMDTTVWNKTQGGSFHLRSSQGTNWLSSTADGVILADVDDSNWQNYEVRAHVRLEGDGQWNCPGLIFYGQDVSNFYMVHYSKLDQKVMLYKRVNGTFNVLNETACQLENNSTHEYKIHVFDGVITVYLDGITMFQQEDSTYTGGCIGFRSYTNGNSATYGMLDNLTVYPVTEKAEIVEQLPEGVLFQETFDDDLSSWTGDGFTVAAGKVTGNGQLLAGKATDSQYRLEAVICDGSGEMGLITHGGAYRTGIDFTANTVTLYAGTSAVASKTWQFSDETLLALSVNGNQVSVWADSSKMIDYTATEETALAGPYGIWADNSTGSFDSVTVYELGTGDELPGDYAYALPAEPLAQAPTTTDADFYCSPNGNDSWSGKLDRPNAERTDGPFATLSRAAEAAAAASGHTTVLVRGGTYDLDSTITLTSGNVTFAAYPGETPILSGGRKIDTRWTQWENGIWKTTLPDSFRGTEIRQLFVEGSRATRSREPDNETWTIRSVDTTNYNWIIPNGDIPASWEGLTGVEINSRGTWHYNRQTVASFDSATNTVTTNLYLGVQASGLKIGANDGSEWSGQDWLFFENALVFVDTEGEWFYDADTNELYYYPTEGADPNEQNIVIPVLETLIAVAGTEEAPVENLNFYGLTFAHTTWSLNPNGTTVERRGIQGGFWGNERTDPVYAPSAAVIFTDSQCCRIQDCLFTHTGEGGVAFGAGADSNLVYGCEFDDVGANCIQVGWRATYTGYGHPLEKEWDDDTDAPQGNQIVQNHIHDCCTTDLGSVGIWVGYANHTLIDHNTIENMPYSGMNVGWRWSKPNQYGNQYNTTSSHNNTISWNYVKNTMQSMADGGAIYCVGEQWNNKVLHNVVDGSNGTGIYLDECSNYTEVGYNYYKNVRLGSFNLNTIYKNAATNNFHDHYFDQTPADLSLYGCETTPVSGTPCFALNFSVNAEHAVICVTDGDTQLAANQSSFDAWQLPAGTYRYTVTAAGYSSISGTVTIAEQPVDLNLSLQKSTSLPAGESNTTPSTTAPIAKQNPFTDVPASAWYCDSVCYVHRNGLMTGVSANSFAPDGAVTRGMIVTVLARMNGLDTTGGSLWYSKGMDWAVTQGISDGTAPKGLLTREQLITMLWRYAGQPASSYSLSGYADANQISDWARNAMVWGVESGLIQGHNEYLDPQGTTTRAQLAAILMRFSAQ